MRKYDLAVIGVGVVTMALAVTTAAIAGNEMSANQAPEAVQTDTPPMTDEQKERYDAWPPDRQAAFNSWGADTQAYFWALNPRRQEFFWALGDEDRKTLMNMAPVEREEAWQQLEQRTADPVPPEPEG